MADGDDDAALVVANGAPLRLITVLLIRAARPDVLLSGYLHLVVDVIEGVKDFVPALQIFDRPIRKNLAHTIHEILPILGAVEIVDHQETALQKVLSQSRGFR